MHVLPSNTPPSYGHHPRWRRSFPGSAEHLHGIRAWTRGQLEGLSDNAQYVAATAVTELATNAIKHTCSGHPGGRVTVEVDASGPWVYIGVTDEGAATKPAVRNAGPGETSGRGLLMLSRLVIDWGHRQVGNGRVVYAIVSR